jgi:hypothetical protein
LRDLQALVSGLSPEILEDAKQELWAWWASLGIAGHPEESGYREYLEMADLAFIKRLVERFAVLAERSTDDPGMRLVLLGD